VNGVVIQRWKSLSLAVSLGMVIAARPSGACTGDLDGDGAVHIDEVVSLVACALVPEPDCTPMRINELVTCVGNALYGCDLDTVWMTKIPCRQCGDCELPIDWLLGNIQIDLVPIEVPEGVTVLDSAIELVTGGVCLACTCPEFGSPIWNVLVPRDDVDTLREHGWYESP
jgi:hypothetical protein